MSAELKRSDLHDTTRLHLEFELAQTKWNLRLGFWDSLAVKCSDAIGRAKKSNEVKRLKELQLGCYNNMGYIHLGNGDSELALDVYDKGKVIAEAIGDENGLATYYVSKGVIHLRRGELDQAIVSYDKSLKLREKLGDERAISNSLNNLGFIYDRQGEYDIALKYYNQSLEIRRKIDDKKGISTCLNNMGQIYAVKGEHDKALEYYREALAIRKAIGYTRGIATAMTNIGSNFKVRGELDSALWYYSEALSIREQTGDKKGISTSSVYVGGIYLDKGQAKKALKYALNGHEVAQQIGYPLQLKNSSKLLSEVYEKLGRKGEALDYYKLHIQMRDSINSEENQKATLAQEAKYTYEKQKVIDDAEHEKELAVEQEAKEKQRIMTIATALGLALVGIFLLFVFSRLRITRKQKSVIEMAHEQLEEKNNEILDSIAYAKRIQSAILPPNKVVKEHLADSFIIYKPKDIVAGDFYWMSSVGEKVLFAAADCTGHGVPGAMVSVICNGGLNRSVKEFGLTDPGKILDKTREIVIQEFEKGEDEVKDGMDIALCALEGNTLEYAGAHNPLWIIRNGEVLETKANKQPIGKFDNLEPYTTHKIELQKGDTIYIFTDGYVDQFGGEKGKKFKANSFKELLLSIQDKSMKEQKTIIDDAFEAWKGDLEQIDDVCVIGVRV